MRFHSVHQRELDAGREEVAGLLAGLGSDGDLLWPYERWPTSPIEFDRPLALGARGGHGLVRYHVEEYEPGRRLVFRFEPGQGLDGRHWFDVEPAGETGTRLVHTIDTRVSGPTRLLSPALRRMHDLTIEDVLDRAELATSGRRPAPQRKPLWMRALDGVERRLMPPTNGRRPGRPARIGGVAVPVALTGIAALHAAWALGWRWPGGSDRAFADRVVGEGAALPPEAATWAVTGLLLGAAGVVGATGRCAGSMPVRAAALGVAGVMLGRGAVGLALDVAGGFGTTYQRLDATIYSPLCVALGAGTLAVLTPRRARSDPSFG